MTITARALPDWFDDAKLGIFVHWTSGAVPAYAPVGPSPFELADSKGWEESFKRSPYVEWYQNSLSIEGSPVSEFHREHYGDAPYDQFVHEFAGGVGDCPIDAWADLCSSAGARYVVHVTKHHDGFVLWPSAHRNPHKTGWQTERDIVGDLAAAVRDRGMRFGTYYSGGLDWTFGGLPITDVRSMIGAIPQTDEYLAYADAHWRELVERYEPCVMWNDIGYPSAADLDGLFEWYFDRVPDGVVNNRFDFVRQTSGDLHADFITPEYSTDGGGGGRKWESCRGVGTSFGFNRREGAEDYLTATELVHMLVDVVARGGNLLLNIGPTGAGHVPWLQAQPVLGMGWWLGINGEAIYGTRPWVTPTGVTHDGTDVRFTATDHAVYAIVMGAPPRRDLGLDVALAEGARAALLGGGEVGWTATPAGTQIELREAPADGPAFALKLWPRALVGSTPAASN